MNSWGSKRVDVKNGIKAFFEKCEISQFVLHNCNWYI